MELGKATIYTQGMLGNVVKIEARQVIVERVMHAQYLNAVQVRFVPKGARKERVIVETYVSHMLILEGHGHPDPAGAFDGGKSDVRDGVTAIWVKHRAFDGGYHRDFADMMTGYLERHAAAWDTRGEILRVSAPS